VEIMDDDFERLREELQERMNDLQEKLRDVEEKINELEQKRSRWDIYDEDLEINLENLEDQRDSIRRELRKVRRRYRDSARQFRRKVKPPKPPKPHKGFVFNLEGLDDFGEGLEDLGTVFSDYFGSFVDSLGKSLEGALGEVFFPGSRKRASRRGKWEIPASQLDMFCDKGSEILSALADSRRLMLLKLLELSPRYQKDLSERASIAGGAFKHHISTLKEYKMVVQEEVRGRYLITPFGRQALKLAEMLFLRSPFGRKITKSKGRTTIKIEEADVEVDESDADVEAEIDEEVKKVKAEIEEPTVEEASIEPPTEDTSATDEESNETEWEAEEF
ncbi:MAG: hypothetical protein ACFFC7_32160, partial [Candidatus Hermodarchaeota archaeon]